MAQANGKLILFGEHAVVYGYPAIAVGLTRGARARATRSPSAPGSELVLGDERVHAGDGSELGRALEALLGALGVGGLRLEITLELPPGAGLGVSAAIAVAAARAALEHEGQPLASERLEAAALAWERVFHGNPSGVDTAAALYGGCLRFVRGQAASALTLARPLRLGVALAGPPASTKQMVEALASERRREPARVGALLESIGQLTEEAQPLLERGELPAVGRLLDRNHELLTLLALSSEALDLACALAREAGALGAKLTGSGGGGCVLALLPERGEDVLESWREAGLTCFESHVAAPERLA